MIVQNDSSWQLVKQSTWLTSAHQKCLHLYDCGWASDKHNILCIHQPAAWSRVLCRPYLEPITNRMAGIAYGMLLSWPVHYCVWEVI